MPILAFENKTTQDGNNNQLRDGHEYGAKWIEYKGRESSAAIHVLRDKTTNARVGSGNVVVHSTNNSGGLNGCKSLCYEEDAFTRQGNDMLPTTDPENDKKHPFTNTVAAFKEVRKIYEQNKGKLGKEQIEKGKGTTKEQREKNRETGSASTWNNNIEYVNIQVVKPSNK